MKTLILLIIGIILIGYTGFAFASHDPNQPQIHSIISPYDAIPPLKQFKIGISEIQCRESLILVTKYDGSPACVKPDTKENLVERGWVFIDYDTIVSRIQQLEEVKIFLKAYPHARAYFDEDSNAVYYQTWGIKPEHGRTDQIMTKSIDVSLDNAKKPKQVMITCGSGISMSTPEVIRFLSQNDWCFKEKYSAEELTYGKAREIVESNMPYPEKKDTLEKYVLEDLDELHFMTSFVTGLKEKYEHGEKVEFTLTQYGYEIPCVYPRIALYLDGYERPIFTDREVHTCPYFDEPSAIINTWNTNKVFDLFPTCRYDGMHSLVTHAKSGGEIEVGRYYCNGEEKYSPPTTHHIVIPKGATDSSIKQPMTLSEINVKWGDFVKFENNDDVQVRIIGDSPRDPSPTSVEFYIVIEPDEDYTTRITYDGIHWIRMETYPDEELIPWLNVTLNVD